jgi:FKBP-type peptidyl-prolyl cis-trans isomerase
VIFATLLVIGVWSQNRRGAAALNTQQDSLSYIIGFDVGEQLHDMGAELEMAPFMEGVEQAIAGRQAGIDEQRANDLRQEFAGEVQEKLEAEQAEAAAEYEKQSEEFLSENRAKSGVQVTPSGLQYEVIQQGSGKKPAASDSVRVSYTGMLVDSTVIDSTAAGQPAVFDLETAIPGLQEGIQMMNVGGVYRFFIPPELAYGENGVAPVIPPNAVLIFDVTLEGIAGEEAPPAS